MSFERRKINKNPIKTKDPLGDFDKIFEKQREIKKEDTNSKISEDTNGSVKKVEDLNKNYNISTILSFENKNLITIIGGILLAVLFLSVFITGIKSYNDNYEVRMIQRLNNEMVDAKDSEAILISELDKRIQRIETEKENIRKKYNDTYNEIEAEISMHKKNLDKKINP